MSLQAISERIKSDLRHCLDSAANAERRSFGVESIKSAARGVINEADIVYLERTRLPALAERIANHRRPRFTSGGCWRVIFDGWELDVCGYYTPDDPPGEFDPGEEASFELYAAYHPDSHIDVSELFEDLESFMVVFLSTPERDAA